MKGLPKKFLKHKYGAVRCETDGIKFPSLLERDCYLTLKNLEKIGKISFFLRQIPVDLGDKVKHFIDFMVVTDENIYFIEAKGQDLALGKTKRQLAENKMKGIPIHVVHNPGEIMTILV